MKISVVMATYKRPALLKRCLEALLTQDFPAKDYEIIVVSDGPDPATAGLIAAMDNPLLRYDMLPGKKGPAAARNLGWRQSKGELIAFTDDDTIPDKYWLPAFWAAYNQEPEVAYTGHLIVPLNATPTDYELNTARLETADFITANCACTRAALEKTGGFDERFETAWREDSDLEFKLLLAHIPIHRVKGAVVLHPVRPAQWGVSLKEQRKSMYNALLFKKYPQLYRKKIQSGPVLPYYAIIGGCILFAAALLAHAGWLAILAALVWLWLTINFIIKRLKHTSRRPDHIIEMAFTSMLIPFLSVYWTLYGAARYRVLFF